MTLRLTTISRISRSVATALGLFARSRRAPMDDGRATAHKRKSGSKSGPGPPQKRRMEAHQRERDTSSLFVLAPTLRCAHSGCIPCCYKLFQHPGPDGGLRLNERPEMCHRLRNSTPPTPANDPFCGGLRRCGLYDERMHILTVGDGNFSFSLAIARALLGPSSSGSLTVTSHESAESVRQVYPDAEKHITELRERGAAVYHGVDATALSTTLPPQARCKYHRIVWNFPCIGRGLAAGADGQNGEMEANKHLVQAFGASAASLLGPSGELHITHKTKPPYCHWNIAEQAIKTSNLLPRGAIVFDRACYQPYVPKKTLDKKSFVVNDAEQFVFERSGGDSDGGAGLLPPLPHTLPADGPPSRRAIGTGNPVSRPGSSADSSWEEAPEATAASQNLGYYRKPIQAGGLRTWPWKKVEKRYGCPLGTADIATEGLETAQGRRQKAKGAQLFRVDTKLLALVRGIAKVTSI